MSNKNSKIGLKNILSKTIKETIINHVENKDIELFNEPDVVKEKLQTILPKTFKSLKELYVLKKSKKESFSCSDIQKSKEVHNLKNYILTKLPKDIIQSNSIINNNIDENIRSSNPLDLLSDEFIITSENLTVSTLKLKIIVIHDEINKLRLEISIINLIDDINKIIELCLIIADICQIAIDSEQQNNVDLIDNIVDKLNELNTEFINLKIDSNAIYPDNNIILNRIKQLVLYFQHIYALF